MPLASNSLRLCAGFFLAVWIAGANAAATDPDSAAGLYAQHCASCHGTQRLGGMGPALLPQSLERLRLAEAKSVISTGRPATQMAGFGTVLTTGEIAQLAQWIYTPVEPAPSWTEADVRATRIETLGAATLPARPLWQADPMNLFVVVEGGSHRVSLVDG